MRAQHGAFDGNLDVERTRAATTTNRREQRARPRTVSEAPETSRLRAHTDYLETVRFATVQKAQTADPRRPARERTSSITIGLLSRSRTTSGRFYQRRGSNSAEGNASGNAMTRMRGRRDSSVHAVDLNVLESMHMPEASPTDANSAAKIADPEGPQQPHVEQKQQEVLSKEEIEEDTCLICLGRFTAKRPAVPIPCVQQCNLAPVHAKCIYEWKEQKQGAGSCPLCRSDLGHVDYQPRDILQLNSLVLFGYRKQFAMSPLPQSTGTLRCYVKVRNGVFGSPVRYELWVQAPTTLAYPLGALPDEQSPRKGDKFVMAGSKRLTKWGTSVIDLSVDPECKDFSPNSHNYLGSVNGNVSGTEFTVSAPVTCASDGRKRFSGTAQREVAAVAYTQNRFGNGSGPRSLSVALARAKACNGAEAASLALGLPAQDQKDLYEEKDNAGDASTLSSTSIVPNTAPEAPFSTPVDDNSEDDDDDDDADAGQVFVSETIVPKRRSEHLVSHLRKGAEAVNGHSQLLYGQNKEPYWLDSIQAYSLDFHGRVQLPSNKNFKLQVHGLSAETDALQFGKVVAISEDVPFAIYTCDFRWPMSPIQAFGVVLTACDRKMLVA
ncbi:Tubby protein-like [Hondaea fermentalgiana]|uniref:Tubby protein-like n=1 Tax=Hondaea fermentalgiana TaxID=2315210 RepID=A0A2R5GFM4_9STRA|nr:Tubby protein-like [Hondaea fermentalgiana]|eukprot:GBG29119.1 Tubby protein-like [Hondaea fermentalgiana]